MSAEPVTISTELRVCADCLAGLEALGGRASNVPAVISLGHGCEAHRSTRHVQAQHVVRVLPSALRDWRMSAPSLSPLRAVEPQPGAVSFVDVATLAARFVVGLDASDEDLLAAVEQARRLLRIAQEGGLR